MEQVRSVTGHLRAAFEQQADAAVCSMGLDPADVFAWAGEHRAEESQKAIQQQIKSRSTEGYKALARSYIEQLDVLDPASILSAQLGAGVSVRRDGQQIVVEAGGKTFTWKSAVRSGLISLSDR